MRGFARLVAVSVLLSAAGLGIVIWLGPPLRLDVLARADPMWLVTSLVVGCGVWFAASALRISLLSRELGGRISFAYGLRVHALTFFGTMVTPGGSGGTPAMALTLARGGLDSAASWSVAIVSLAIDTLFFAWTVPLVLPLLIVSRTLPASTAWLPLSILAMLISLALAILLMFRLAWLRKVSSWIFRGPLFRVRRRALRSIDHFVRSSSAFATHRAGWQLRMQGLTLIAWLGYLSVLPMVAIAFGMSPSPAALIAFQLLVTAISAVVPTPGASGFFEAAIGTFLHTLDRSAPAPAIALTWRLATFYLFLGIGAVLGGLMVAESVGPPDGEGTE